MTRKLFSLRAPTRSESAERTGKFFNAVEIRCSADGCPAAQSLRGRRFLCAEAPTLPLQQCDRVPHCECHYRHFEDRRQGPRRADEAGAPPPARQRSVDERRQRGRRTEDHPDDDDTSLLDDTYYDYVAGNPRE